MGNYNAIAGISEENLNRLTLQVYENLYKSSRLFKDTRIFDKLLLYSVSYDVTTAPVFTLAPSPMAKETMVETINNLPSEAEEWTEFRKFIEEGAVTFSVGLPVVKLSVVIEKDKPPVVDLIASVTAGCSVEINNEGKVIPRIVSAKIKLKGFEIIENALNKIALPFIIELVNKFVSKGFTLPLIKLVGAEFSHPQARIENKTLVTYAALKNTGPTLLPDQYTWPRDKAFAYFDKTIAECAATAALADTQKSGSAELDIPIFPGVYLMLRASFLCGVKDPVFEFKEGIETGNTFTAYGGGKLSIQITGLDPVSASFTVAATPTASSVLQLAGGQLIYSLQHINDFKVYIDLNLSFLPLPDFIKKLINDSLSFILKPIAQLIGEILRGLTIKICNIKPVEFEISGVKMTISLADNTIATTTGPDNKKLVCVEGILGVAHPD